MALTPQQQAAKAACDAYKHSLSKAQAFVAQVNAAAFGRCRSTEDSNVPGCGRPLTKEQYSYGDEVCSDFPHCCNTN